MYSRISVVFHLKKHGKIEGRYKINIRIFHKRKKSEIVTDIYTTLDKWNLKVGRPVDDPETSAKLAKLESDIFRVKEQLVMEGYEISSKLIKDVFTGESKIRYGVVEYFEKFIENKPLWTRSP